MITARGRPALSCTRSGWTAWQGLGRLPVFIKRRQTMRPVRLLAFLVLFLVSCLGTVAAQTAMYTVTVPVADTSAAVRDQASATGLTQVLARASNGADPRSKAGYADAMKQPGGLVQ